MRLSIDDITSFVRTEYQAQARGTSGPLEPAGIALVDKPAGPSSFKLVAELRRRRTQARTGHAGTLDPFATGLLLIVVRLGN